VEVSAGRVGDVVGVRVCRSSQSQRWKTWGDGQASPGTICLMVVVWREAEGEGLRRGGVPKDGAQRLNCLTWTYRALHGGRGEGSSRELLGDRNVPGVVGGHRIPSRRAEGG